MILDFIFDTSVKFKAFVVSHGKQLEEKENLPMTVNIFNTNVYFTPIVTQILII